MTDNAEKLAGVFVPVVTPFRDEELSLDDLRHNLRGLRKTAIKGYLALGSNAEYRSLTDAERIRVLEVFAEEKGDKVVMVGTGCESAKETIDKSRAVAEMGFDYVSVLTPSYFAKRMDGPTLQGFFERIADAVSIPMLLYNAPGFAGGVTIPPKTLVALSQHSNIVGVKDSSPTGPAKFLSQLDPRQDFHVLAGSASFTYPSLMLGARGAIMSLANALPDPCAQLYECFANGMHDEARELHFRLSRLNDAISGTGGVAAVKAAMDICGYRGGEPRCPLTPVSNEARAAIRQAIRDERFLEVQEHNPNLPRRKRT